MVRSQQLANVKGWERDEFFEETDTLAPDDVVNLLTRSKYGHGFVARTASKRDLARRLFPEVVLKRVRAAEFHQDVENIDDVTQEVVTLNQTVRALSQKIEQLENMVAQTHQLMLAMSQSYFWTPEWQAKERQADKDEATGASKVYASADELIKDLNK